MAMSIIMHVISKLVCMCTGHILFPPPIIEANWLKNSQVYKINAVFVCVYIYIHQRSQVAPSDLEKTMLFDHFL